MITEIQANIQALATIESLTNDIDTLAVIDRQVKDLTAKSKKLKDSIANQYGDGAFRGEKYGVRVVIANVAGSVDYAALCKQYGITDAQLDGFRKESIARITVTSTI
jgi:hypothetical protein